MAYGPSLLHVLYLMNITYWPIKSLKSSAQQNCTTSGKTCATLYYSPKIIKAHKIVVTMCWGFECGQFGVVRLDTKPRCITYSIHSLSSESSSSVSCGLCLLAHNIIITTILQCSLTDCPYTRYHTHFTIWFYLYTPMSHSATERPPDNCPISRPLECISGQVACLGLRVD